MADGFVTMNRQMFAAARDARLGTWAQLGEAAAQIRTEVFVKEQGIAARDEWDAHDASAVHAVVFNPQGQPVATGRLLLACPGAEPGAAHIGRVAVLREWRGSGVGRRVMWVLEQAAQAHGLRRLRLNAQASAEGFYRQLGYRPCGAPFDEVGIAHIPMQTTLD